MTYILMQLLQAGLFIALLLVIGRCVETLLFNNRSLPVSFLSGIVYGSTVLFLMASFRLYSPVWIAAALLPVCACFVWKRRELVALNGKRRDDRSIPPDGVIHPHIIFFLKAAIGSVLFSLLMQALNPALSWDAAVYHLTIPRIYLQHGGFITIPFNVYSNWPMAIDLLYGAGLCMGGQVTARLLHFAFGAILMTALFCLVRSRWGSLAGLLAVVLFLANGVVLYEMKTAYVDIALAFLLFMGFTSLLSEDGGRQGKITLYMSAFLLSGCKVTGMSGVLVLVFTALFFSAGAASEFWQRSKRAALILVAGILGLLPWLVKSYIMTGNPAYPFLYSIFAGPDWSLDLSRKFAEWQFSTGTGHSLIELLFLPYTLLTDGIFHFERYNGTIGPQWIVLIPLMLVAGWRDRLSRAALFTSLLYLFFWGLGAQQMRFLIPVLPLLSIAAARILVIPGRSGSVRAGVRFYQAGVGIAAGILLLTLAIPQFRGAVNTLKLISEYGSTITEVAVPPLFRFINHRTAPRSKILFINTNQGFFCEREFIADSFFEASQVGELLAPALSVTDLVRILNERGVTHILYCGDEWGIAYPESLYHLLSDPVRAPLLFGSSDNRYSLYRVNFTPF